MSAVPPVCATLPTDPVPAPPEPTCDNATLAGYDGLLIIAPHPDDEILGFSGLATAYMAAGKPVDVLVVTDGDAYCEACRFWKSESVHGELCDALDLSNFATPEVDSFAEVRRGESTTAAAAIGRPAPTFLGYPDTGLAAAWLNSRMGRLDTPLRRSDFSGCTACETCDGGYGEGPTTELTAAGLIATLSARIAATSENTLLATTHPLDGHGDHSGLGNFVKTINEGLDSPRPVAYAIIHAHTANGTPAPDCWYPGPAAVACSCPDERCAEADPSWIATLRGYRFHPQWPDAFPDDAPYGEAHHLCLPEPMYSGESATKLAAVSSFKSQLGMLARDGDLPPQLSGIVDCNGYLTAFVRRTEAFLLSDPAMASADACDPSGTWEGRAGVAAETGDEIWGALRLTLSGGEGGRLEGRLSRPGAEGEELSEAVSGERDGCSVALTLSSGVFQGTISRDGKSLYAERTGGGGFVVVHR